MFWEDHLLLLSIGSSAMKAEVYVEDIIQDHIIMLYARFIGHNFVFMQDDTRVAYLNEVLVTVPNY